jgi:hypothetical protein
MALYRTALRLATVEALRPAKLLGTQGPWPTLAGACVFDTRIDPIEDLAQGGRKPVIAVYTEGDIGYGSQKRGGPPFRREVDLVFEISSIELAPSDADPGVFVAGVSWTDAELEATLDRIETEIYYALLFATRGPTMKVGELTKTVWRALTGSMVSDPRSHPHRSSEEGARYAMRTLTWKVQVADDWFDGSPREQLKGFDRFPEPLRSAAQILSDCSLANARLLGGLADGMPAPPPLPRLKKVGLDIEIIPRSGKRSGAANVSALIGLPLWTERRS